MKRLFQKGQMVKAKNDGKVMEVINYIQVKSRYLVECRWFDHEKREIFVNRFKEENLRNAS